MTEGDRVEQDREPGSRGVPRRALLGGAITAAAAGIVGYEVGSAGAATDDAEPGEAAGAPEARAVAVEPQGELVADDVQAALVDVYGRTSALARLEDLRVAYELVDDFPPRADGRIGSLGWTAVTAGSGAAVASAPLEGGVVRLTPGPAAGGRAAVHLGLDQHVGAPVFTMQWRLTLEGGSAGAATARLAFGVLASVTDDVGADTGPALVWLHDPELGPNWTCRGVQGGEVVDVDTGRAVDGEPHRFTITSDGDGLARFSLDDDEVARIPTDLEDTGRHGQGLVVATAGGAAATVAVDWFYLRRELPR